MYIKYHTEQYKFVGWQIPNKARSMLALCPVSFVLQYERYHFFYCPFCSFSIADSRDPYHSGIDSIKRRAKSTDLIGLIGFLQPGICLSGIHRSFMNTCNKCEPPKDRTQIPAITARCAITKTTHSLFQKRFVLKYM